MAKGLSDDEIMKFIKSKDVSSKDYKAPKTKITKIDLSKVKTDNVKNTKTDNSVKNKVLRKTLVNTKPDNSNKKVNQTIYNKNAVRTSQKPEPKSIGSIDIVRNQSELRKTQNELQRQRERRLNPEGKNAAVETVKQAKQAMRAVEKAGEKEAKNLIDFSTNAYDYAKAIKNKDDKKEAEAVSNMANAFDRSLVGRGLKTAGNFATRTGYGALKGADWMLDWSMDKMTSKPLQYARFAEKALNPDKKEEINKKYDTIQNYLDDYTKLNLAENIYEDLGWDEDAYRTWEKGSLVNRNNIGGQVAETMGEQFLPLLLGSEVSSNLVGNSIGNKFAGTKLSKATAGLTGVNKYLTGIKTAGENAAKYFIKNAPSLMPFWTTSYGGALEEALNEGATREEARRYATLNAAVETGTEMMFDGIPAIKGSSSTADAIANGLIDKATGKITNKFAKQVVSYLARMGYVGAGEGAEEMVSEILNPLLKNYTYSNGEKIDWKQVLQSGMMGFISGEVMGAQNTFEESRNAVNNQINRETFQNSIQNTVNNAAQTTFQEITSQLDQLAQQRVQQIDQAVRQGQMTAQEGTQEIEDIQRYVDAQKNTLQQKQQPQQNQNNQLAQQAVQQINQQVQSGQISPQDGMQQIEDIQNYLRAQEAQTEQQQSGNLVEDYMNDNYESLVGDYIDQNYGQQQESNLVEDYMNNGEDNLVNDYMNNYENGNMVENFMNAQSELQQAQQDNIKKQTNAFNLGQKETKLPTNTDDKIQNFRNSVKNENIKDADGFYKAVEKIISDKDYNVVLDSSIKNKQGRAVNALITNENGITIKINPNSNRAAEILLTHEVTHGIETKEMRNLIMDYASKNSEFNEALESLKKAYGTNDVTSEVVADISGQLFGNQEFINNLSTEKPGVFKRIYNKIVELANKLTGNSKQALFIRDLKNKWETAYREANIESSQIKLKDQVKYSQNGEITDNKGRELNINMQNYMEDSQATDDKGQLVTVYHTVNHPVSQFNVFNPVGTPGYRFKNDFVTYFTDSKEMSGSYADQDYIEADTKRYTKVEEVEDFINKLNEITHNRDEWELVELPENNAVDKLARFEFDNRFNGKYKDDPELAYKRGLITKQELEDATIKSKYAIQNNENDFIRFKSEDDLLRNFKNKLADKLSELRKNPLSFDGSTKKYNEQKWQYEGYVNITKPYIVDAEGRNWNNITQEVKEDAKKAIDSLTDEQKDYLSDLAKKSTRKCNEWKRSEDYEKYLEYNHIYENYLDNTTSENLVILSMKDNATPQDYIDMYNEFGKEGKAPDSKITVPGKDIDFAEFAAEWCRLENEAAKYGEYSSYFMSEAMKKYGEQLRTVGVSDMYAIAERGFREKDIDWLLSEKLTTNDVVKKVLQMNKDGEDYDGVIIKNTTDYGGYSEDSDPHDLYITFSPEQFKAWNNPDPTNDPDIRYSEKAKQWQDFLEKNYKNTGTTTKLNEKIGTEKKQTEVPQTQRQQRETKSEPVLKVDLTGEKGKEYFMENGADEKVAQILSEKPKQKTNKMDAAKKTAGEAYRLLVSSGGEVERIAKVTNRPDVKYKLDKSMRADAEANQHIGKSQRDLNYKQYKNFTDENGNKTSMSLNGIREDAKRHNIPESVLNEYLAHNLNVDRYMEDKPVFGKSVTSDDSLKRIAEIEQEHPEIKRIAQNVWTYEHNDLKNIYESGRISKEDYDRLAKYEHYVRIQRNIEKKGSNAAVIDKNGKISVNQGIQQAKGGNQDILPIMETIAQRTVENTRANRLNEAAKELGSAISMGSEDSTISAIEDEESFGVNPDLFKQNDDGTYTMTFFDKGKATVVPINKAIYDAFVTNKAISAIENNKVFQTVTYAPKKMSSMFRAVVTDKNPMFMATNALRDIGDAPFNSKYTKEFAKAYASTEALRQVAGNGVYNQLYNAAGGQSDSYFTEGEFKDKAQSKIGKATEKLLTPIEKGNEIVETVPRMAEFIATIKANGYEVNKNGDLVLKDSKKAKGRTAESVLDEALYNAAEVTTNFKRGGDLAKAINRNGGTFFNASIQGFDKQIRNFKDAFTSGDKKKIVGLLLKALIFGIAPTMLNDAANDDDDEYKNMQDYLKDNYYLFKGKDGNYIRIPKGRAMSVIGSAYRRTKDYVSGEKDAFKGFTKFASGQVAPNNPFESNIIAPFFAVKNNKSWSGNSIVSQTLEEGSPTEERYTEKTDEFSKWLGKQLKNAPIPERYKTPAGINYLIDQYTGGAGDVLLPMITPKATSKTSNPLVQPFISKFTTDSVYQQKDVNKFYDVKKKLKQQKGASYATKEDKVKSSYMESRGKELSALYAEQHEIQNDKSLSKKEKYEQAREVQKKINKFANESVKNVNDIKDHTYYATIGDDIYYLTIDKKTGKDIWSKDSYADSHKKAADKKGMALYDYYKEKYEERKAKEK